MSKVKVIFGSTTGNTERAADLIAAALGGDAVNVSSASRDDFDAKLLILGTSTWGCGDLQDDWLSSSRIIDTLDLTGRKVALFGLGDSLGFGDTFINGVGTLYRQLISRGAEIIGKCPVSGYEFSDSSAVVDGEFVGLPLDDDNEPEKSESRISAWCGQLKAEAGL